MIRLSDIPEVLARAENAPRLMGKYMCHNCLPSSNHRLPTTVAVSVCSSTTTMGEMNHSMSSAPCSAAEIAEVADMLRTRPGVEDAQHRRDGDGAWRESPRHHAIAPNPQSRTRK